MILHWARKAHLDRVDIFDFLVRKDLNAASVNDDRIPRALDFLLNFPEIGRPGRRRGTREMIVDKTSYIVAYRLKKQTIEVVRIMHASRQWPRM